MQLTNIISQGVAPLGAVALLERVQPCWRMYTTVGADLENSYAQDTSQILSRLPVACLSGYKESCLQVPVFLHITMLPVMMIMARTSETVSQSPHLDVFLCKSCCGHGLHSHTNPKLIQSARLKKCPTQL